MNGLELYIVAVALPIMFGFITLMRLEFNRAKRWSSLYFGLTIVITGIYAITSFIAAQMGDKAYGLIFYIAMLCFLVQMVTLIALKKSNLKRVLGVNLIAFSIVSCVFLEFILIRAL